jgi:L-threonylcarbamoyladenylate synthase
MEIVKIDPNNPQKEKIKYAAAILKKGGVIAFPTDTVYGLGANALNKKAVLRIYQIKKRDKNKPLIILLGRKKDAEKYAYLTVKDKRLIAKFWPGPLTLVLKAKKSIPKHLTKNGTIGLRMPKNRIFISLARACEFPLATTSANLSGEASTTSAQEVKEKVGGKIDLMIDGGTTKTNTASTILDASTKTPKIIRLGKINFRDIKGYLSLH